MKSRTPGFDLIYCAFLLIVVPTAIKAEPPKRLAEGIQDNSFLIEEAYNQKALAANVCRRPESG